MGWFLRHLKKKRDGIGKPGENNHRKEKKKATFCHCHFLSHKFPATNQWGACLFETDRPWSHSREGFRAAMTEPIRACDQNPASFPKGPSSDAPVDDLCRTTSGGQRVSFAQRLCLRRAEATSSICLQLPCEVCGKHRILCLSSNNPTAREPSWPRIAFPGFVDMSRNRQPGEAGFREISAWAWGSLSTSHPLPWDSWESSHAASSIRSKPPEMPGNSLDGATHHGGPLFVCCQTRLRLLWPKSQPPIWPNVDGKPTARWFAWHRIPQIYVPKCHGYAFCTWTGAAARAPEGGPGGPKIQLLRRRSRDDLSSRQDGDKMDGDAVT